MHMVHIHDHHRIGSITTHVARYPPLVCAPPYTSLHTHTHTITRTHTVLVVTGNDSNHTHPPYTPTLRYCRQHGLPPPPPLTKSSREIRFSIFLTKIIKQMAAQQGFEGDVCRCMVAGGMWESGERGGGGVMLYEECMCIECDGV